MWASQLLKTNIQLRDFDISLDTYGNPNNISIFEVYGALEQDWNDLERGLNCVIIWVRAESFLFLAFKIKKSQKTQVFGYFSRTYGTDKKHLEGKRY